MPDQIHINPVYASWFPKSVRGSIEAMARHANLDVSQHRKRSLVKASTLKDDQGRPLNIHFKAYAKRSHAFDGFARQSIGRIEAETLQNFQRWHIRTPDVIAWGTRRSLFGLASDLSFIITQSAPDTLTLLDYWLSLDQPAESTTRNHIIDTLAEQTRQLHAKRFYHRDLKWRNVLIDRQGSLPQVWWIDCPSGHFSRLGPRQKHGRIKDLATLDMVARKRCTKEERLRFVQVYLNEPSITATVEAWAKAVDRYRQTRFD